MLSFLNAYADGYVAVPVIHACKKQGLFTALQENTGIQFADLVTQLNANAGYLKIALHLLESLGWVQQNQTDTYQLVEKKQWQDLPQKLFALYEISADTLLQSEAAQHTVCYWADYFAKQPHLTTTATDLTWSERIKGALFVPLLIALHQSAERQDGEMKTHFTSPLDAAIRRLFVHHHWGEIQQERLVLSEMGIQLVEHAEVMGIAASYRPMLAQMPALLFGDACAVFQNRPDGSEGHIDRSSNVLASGFQHNRYFQDAQKQILALFNEQPIEKQPRYIADMGCGDGTFLKHIYQIIRDNSVRGKVLNEYPLTLIGIDYNEVALQTSETTLADLPHLLLQGDINTPQQVLADLKTKGITDTSAIMHIRSFLDHNFNCAQAVSAGASKTTIPMSPGSVYVDMQGEPILPEAVIAAWQQHLSRWSEVIRPHGLMLFEAHCLSATWIHQYLGQSENLYFDHLHAFSKQYLIDAEVFLTLAARVGLFPKSQPLRYPKTLPFCRVTFSHFEKRDYQIRHATQDDLPDLARLETCCWPEALQTPSSTLRNRIGRYPQGQFVLTLEERVVGVIYTQRIHQQETVFNMTADTADAYHQPQGELVQLLAINILPEMQKKQLGQQLLEWMLQRCSVMNGVTAVVGVTLCKNYSPQASQSLLEYIQQRESSGYLADPILRFHELHGATIVGLVPHYRPKDVSNEGQGVLIHYDIFGRTPKPTPASQAPAISPSQSELSVGKEIADTIETLIRKCLGKDREAAYALNKPLREMGLDSADVMELTLQVGRQYQLPLNPAFFFRYNTVARIATYLHEQLNQKTSS